MQNVPNYRKNPLTKITLILMVMTLMVYCTKKSIDPTPANLTAPTLSVSTVSDIAQETAKATGKVETIGSSAVTQVGHCWAEGTTVPTTANSKTVNGSGTAGQSITSNLTSLKANTSYTVRAYATNATGTGYGESVSFKTLVAVVNNTTPKVETVVSSDVSVNGVTGKGKIIEEGSVAVTEYGVVWALGEGTPTFSNNKVVSSNRDVNGSFSSVISGLVASTTYSLAAYATNANGTSYGTKDIIKTADAPSQNAPSVETSSIGTPTVNSISASGKITNNGSSNVTEYGFVWALGDGLPTLSNTKVLASNRDGNGDFSATISGLNASTVYSLRAFATNGNGTNYGANKTFTTATIIVTNIAPTITTGDFRNVMNTSADASGTITDKGNSDISAYGICYVQGTNTPTINDSKMPGGAVQNGAFSASLTGLSANTKYTYRAYATNAGGTSYGGNRDFTTQNVTATCNTNPTVSTVNASDITQTTANVIGKIDNNGGTVCTVIEYGHVWALNSSADPTVATNLSKTTKTTAIANGANFTSALPSLTAGIAYKVRAYAKNQTGNYVYSAVVTFTTVATVCTTNPTVNIATAGTSITSTTASILSAIANEGGGNCQVTEYGHVWGLSTSTDPTVSTNVSKTSFNTAVSAGSNFTSVMTGLVASTSYKVRAYAKNQTGTYAYSSSTTITTAAACTTNPTVNIFNAFTNITTTTASIGGTVVSEGGGSCQVAEYGHVWGLSTGADPTILTNLNKTSFTAVINAGGNYTSTMNALTAGTSYKVRAYAKNQTGNYVYSTTGIITTTAVGVSVIKIANNASFPITKLTVIEGTQAERQITLSGGHINVGALFTFNVLAGSVVVKTLITGGVCSITENTTLNVPNGTTVNTNYTNPSVQQLMTNFKISGFTTYTAVTVLAGGALFTVNYYFYTDGKFGYEDSNNVRRTGTYTLLSWPVNSVNVSIRTSISGDFVVPCPFIKFASNGLNFERQ
jgi:hypothetical protein